LIEASELVKTYPPEIRAVEGVSLSIPAGTIFGLLGPNGAGKSTTMRMLCTLTRPTSGTARVAGIDVLTDPLQVRRRIGVVTQRGGADREATGRENLLLQGHFHGLHGADLKRRVDAMLERFELAAAADRLVKTYSGGMQRRLDVAMGLLHDPQVLFLDEPTTGLDPEARVEMWHDIAGLAQREQMTILLTTHYMEEADRLASELAIIDRGQIVARGTPSDLKAGLQGDAIQVDLAEPASSAGQTLRAIEGVSDISVEGPTLRARARDAGAAVPTVLAALERDGHTVASVTFSRPSLEDVYLRHAGRAFHAAEREEVAA
jgi:ABC-2 type transport system ATP-binding protein